VRRNDERPFSLMLDVVAPVAGILIGVTIFWAVMTALEGQITWLVVMPPTLGGP
jgi:hypothetical protein